VYAADQLFATLDTTARRAWVGSDCEVVLSDTVGFIRGLPHQLVDAFKSTLEETVQADVLLHVVDVSSPMREEQMHSVAQVLEEIGAESVPMITVFNKIDKTGHATSSVRDDVSGRVKSVFLSAKNAEGLDLLRQALSEYAAEKKKKFSETVAFATSSDFL